MCRYATLYKPHYACFKCQKTFKRRLLKDVLRSRTIVDEIPAKCPECGGLMANMGLDFKSPKKSDDKTWQRLELMYQVGLTFHSCGCSGPGLVPKDNAALIKDFEATKACYLKHQHFWAQRRQTPSTQSAIDKDKNKNWEYLYSIPKDLRFGKSEASRLEAQRYWNDKVKAIEVKIAFLKTHKNK